MLKLKASWRDGTTHLMMSPLEFMQRPAARVPHQLLHLIRFYGVLVPNAKLRNQVVPKGPESSAQATQTAQYEGNAAHHHPVRPIWAELLKRVGDRDLECRPYRGRELTIHAAVPEQLAIELRSSAHRPRHIRPMVDRIPK